MDEVVVLPKKPPVAGAVGVDAGVPPNKDVEPVVVGVLTGLDENENVPAAPVLPGVPGVAPKAVGVGGAPNKDVLGAGVVDVGVVDANNGVVLLVVDVGVGVDAPLAGVLKTVFLPHVTTIFL